MFQFLNLICPIKFEILDHQLWKKDCFDDNGTLLIFQSDLILLHFFKLTKDTHCYSAKMKNCKLFSWNISLDLVLQKLYDIYQLGLLWLKKTSNPRQEIDVLSFPNSVANSLVALISIQIFKLWWYEGLPIIIL